MRRGVLRCLVGLVVAVALAWGAGQGLRADTSGSPAKPALTAATVSGPATIAAKAEATAMPLIPAKPIMGASAPATTAATTPAAGAPAQNGQAKGKVTRDQVYVDKFKRPPGVWARKALDRLRLGRA